MNIKESKLYKWSSVILGDIRSKIVGVIFLYLLSTSGILWLKNGLQLPVPLWLVILICLSLLLCGGLLFLLYSRHTSARPYETSYWPTGKYTWEAKIYKDGTFEVNKYPICTKHDLRFIFGNRGKYCPAPNCTNRIDESEEFKIIQTVKSIIENKIRNKKW